MDEYLETYEGTIENTDPNRKTIGFSPLVYRYEDGLYFDKLDEALHDELIYMEPGETLTLTLKRLT